jgi:hypothetical protein
MAERLKDDEGTCGVCVDKLATGQVAAILRFGTAVQEVFAETVLPNGAGRS